MEEQTLQSLLVCPGLTSEPELSDTTLRRMSIGNRYVACSFQERRRQPSSRTRFAASEPPTTAPNKSLATQQLTGLLLNRNPVPLPYYPVRAPLSAGIGIFKSPKSLTFLPPNHFLIQRRSHPVLFQLQELQRGHQHPILHCPSEHRPIATQVPWLPTVLVSGLCLALQQ